MRGQLAEDRLSPLRVRPMRYGEGLLEEIRRRTDLVALVGRRVKLVRKGRVMWGCCPFHNEKSAQLQGRE